MRRGFWTLAAVLVASSAHADTIHNYSNCDGANGTVSYVDIFEVADSDPLYGTPITNEPTCTANQIDFDPNGFAVSAGNPDPDGTFTLAGQLNFTILSDAGNFIDEIAIGESGDYQVLGIDPSATSAHVDLGVRLEIVLPSGGGPELFIPFEDTQGASFVIPDDFSTSAQSWSLEATFLIDDILDDACNGNPPFTVAVPEACDALVSKVRVIMDNALEVTAESGERAFINKKDLDGLTITVMDGNVPEPGTAALLLLGLVGLGLRGRALRR